jgi:cytochrome c oxidase assembly factor CtaG
VIALALGAAAIVVYLYAVGEYRRRYPAREFPVARVVAFVSGCVLLSAALSPWADARSDVSFAAHMLQHMVLLLIAPPLILLGAPLLLLVAVPSHDIARNITRFANSPFGHALLAPVTAWLLYVFVLWGAHFSALYELALEYPAVHVLEHVLFIGSAFLFWNAIVQVGYVPRPVPYAARMFYLFLAIPQGAFLGFALNATRHVLYPHYTEVLRSGSLALVDQHNGADLMWLLGGFLLFAAFMFTAGAWAASERRAQSVP